MRPGVAPSIEPKVRAVGLLAASVGLLAASVGLLAVDAKASPSPCFGFKLAALGVELVIAQ